MGRNTFVCFVSFFCGLLVLTLRPVGSSRRGHRPVGNAGLPRPVVRRTEEDEGPRQVRHRTGIQEPPRGRRPPLQPAAQRSGPRLSFTGHRRRVRRLVLGS